MTKTAATQTSLENYKVISTEIQFIFIISKWDILEQHSPPISLAQVIIALRKFDPFTDFVRSQTFKNKEVRLIPLSSLRGLVRHNEQTGEEEKLPIGHARPENYDLPLAYAMIDTVKQFSKRTVYYKAAIDKGYQLLKKQFSNGAAQAIKSILFGNLTPHLIVSALLAILGIVTGVFSFLQLRFTDFFESNEPFNIIFTLLGLISFGVAIWGIARLSTQIDTSRLNVIEKVRNGRRAARKLALRFGKTIKDFETTFPDSLVSKE